MDHDNRSLEALVKAKSKKLLAAQRRLFKAQQLSRIGALSAAVAHELRNPLSVIKMVVYNIKKKPLAPVSARHLTVIEKKIAESEQIINDLLCRRIVTLHNGTIAIKSRKNKGTAVTIRLPIHLDR